MVPPIPSQIILRILEQSFHVLLDKFRIYETTGTDVQYADEEYFEFHNSYGEYHEFIGGKVVAADLLDWLKSADRGHWERRNMVCTYVRKHNSIRR
jgi:hypothetical protein